MRTVIGVLFIILAFAIMFVFTAFARGIETAVFIFAFAFVLFVLILIGAYFISW